MDKEFKRNITVVIIIAVFILLVGGIAGSLIGAAVTRSNRGGEDFTGNARELLTRIGEYEQREREYLQRERERTARENARIAREDSRLRAERERYSRTAAQLGAIRESDRRSGDIYQEIIQTLDILEDYFRRVGRELGYDDNSNAGE